MNSILRKKTANLLRGMMGIEKFDAFSLRIGMNSHYNSNLREMAFLKRVFYADHSVRNSPCTLIDVGANRGLWADAFCRNFDVKSAHLFEPNENVAFRFFRCSVSDLHLNPIGLSSQNGTCRMRMSKYPGVTSSIGRDSVYEDAGEEKEIQVVTLEDYFKNLGSIPQGNVVLKVDVEGHDLDVLRGTESLFERDVIRFVVIEVGCNPDDQDHINYRAAYDALSNYGFFFAGFSEQFLSVNESFYGIQYGNAVFARP
jgi:FkbM family methyltransferase